MTRRPSEPGDAPPPLPPPPGAATDWAELRAAYEACEETIAILCKRFVVTRREIAARRLSEGWTAHPQIADPGRGRSGRNPTSANLATRLMRSLRRQIAMLEERVMSENYEQSDADVRLMNELARGLQRIGKLTPDSGPGNASEKAPDKAAEKAMEAEAADAEWMRDQLRKRLARLAERQRQGSLSEGDDT